MSEIIKPYDSTKNNKRQQIQNMFNTINIIFIQTSYFNTTNYFHTNYFILNHTKYILEQIGKKEFYLSSFGQDASGEIYLIDYNGSLYKIFSN